MDFYFIEEGKLIFENNGETLQIEAWGENSLRVRSRMMGEIIDTDYALLPNSSDVKAKIEIDKETQTATIENGKITAIINHSRWETPGRISFYNEKGELLLKEISRGGALKLQARAFKPIIGGDHKLIVSFEGNDNEKIYGMGQYQQETFDLKGSTLELAHRNSQASVPFLFSSKGYGFLWHNPAIGKVNFAKNITEWFAESTKQLDYWITAGDSPAEIEMAYGKAVGTVPMMPEYGLGFWQCKLRYYNQEQLLNVAREYKKRKLPIDVIVIDFFHWPKQGDFRFEEEFFPDPKAMVDELKELGIELMVSVWPQIDRHSENYEEMQQKGYLIKVEKGVDVAMMGWLPASIFYDATNPKARKYVWSKCKKNYYDYGIKIFWLDEAEPEYDVYDFENYRYALGPNAQIGNVYPQHYSKTFYEGMKEEGQENIVNLVRCAWAGSQRYGALVWSGDIHSSYEDFRKQIVAGLHMGIAGIPWWTTDIGGFSGGNPDDPKFRELLIRWFQWGAFCPVMRLHGDRAPGAEVIRKDGSNALFTGGNNEVWSFGDEAYKILVKYMELRETLRDYTRELMKEAHENGAPIMRPLFFEFPNDENVWDINDEYLYGADILIAPIIYEGATSRDVYLPKGSDWTDAHTGKIYNGGQTITTEAPIEVIPVFLRDGKQEYLISKI
ncbi:TIM-barrel domain-containing protein [Clostridium sp.]|uniref:glycoside hydrolase family 31 protein n=1 Tax=Clostridium sp. TaxID=1506 RepID=UPI0028480003|nr:TIM-barrel domain-containing protein [Clostridium sp.]MDR3598390.1 glycoside hydrolase family 31 protein [Clostridium sp.]